MCVVEIVTNSLLYHMMSAKLNVILNSSQWICKQLGHDNINCYYLGVLRDILFSKVSGHQVLQAIQCTLAKVVCG